MKKMKKDEAKEKYLESARERKGRGRKKAAINRSRLLAACSIRPGSKNKCVEPIPEEEEEEEEER